MSHSYFTYPAETPVEMIHEHAIRSLDDTRACWALVRSAVKFCCDSIDAEQESLFDCGLKLCTHGIRYGYDRDALIEMFDYVTYAYAWGDVHGLEYDPITLGQMEQIQHKRDEELFALNRKLDEDHIDEFNALVNKIRDIWNGKVDGVSTVGMCEIATCDALMDAVEWDGLTTGRAYLAWKEAKVSCEWDVIVDAFHSHADYHKFDYVAVRGF